MTSPAFASIGAYIEDSSASANFPVPSGVATGDIIVIPIYVDGVTGTITDYALGFAEAENSPVPNASALPHTIHVVWKRASVADAGTYDFTLSAPLFRTGAAVRYTGCATSGSPWDSPTDSASDTNDGISTPSVDVTTLGANRLLVWSGSSWSANTWTPPVGFSERIDSGVGTLTLADKAQAVAGNSGSVVGTPANSTRRSAWLGALKPAVTDVPGTASAALGGLSAAATGVRTTVGTALASLGGLSGLAVGSVTTPAVAASSSSGWYGLLSIRREAEQWAAYERSMPPIACPHDGEPLSVGPGGVLYCKFDGWRLDR